MAEYIEREQAINFARSSAAAAYNRDDFGAYRDLNAFIATLVFIPTADATPVVHGHWERIDDPEFICGDFECSNCSHREYEIDTDDCTPGVNCLHYCPNCGAKMDEVTK